MKKYKIDNYIVTVNSLHDAVSVVRQIKDAYNNGIILEKHETYKGPNGQFTVVKVRRDNGRIQYVVTSDKRDIDAGDKMPSGTIENDLASAKKTAQEYATKRTWDAAPIQIKAYFGDWKTVSKEQAKDFVKTMMKGMQAVPEAKKPAIIEEKHLRGISVKELLKDATKDSVTVREVIESLVAEETSAIASYNVALETLKDHIPDEAYEAIKAIRDDEQRHVENLYAVLNGNVTPKNLEN